jgi:hypothetical protein
MLFPLDFHIIHELAAFYFSLIGWWNYPLKKLLGRLQADLWGYALAWNFGLKLKQKKNYTKMSDLTPWT